MMHSSSDLNMLYTLIDTQTVGMKRQAVDNIYNDLGFTFQTALKRFEGDQTSVDYQRERDDILKVSNVFDTSGICIFKKLYISLAHEQINDKDIEIYMEFFDKINNHLKTLGTLIRCMGDFKANEVLHIEYIKYFEKECNYTYRGNKLRINLHISKESGTKVRTASISISETNE